MKKMLSLLLALVMVLSLAACGGKDNTPTPVQQEGTDAPVEAEGDDSGSNAEGGDAGDDYHIGIVTGSVSQSEDDRRGAEAFEAAYGSDRIKLAIYPDNFTEELETTIQTIVNLSDDPDMKEIGRAHV